MVHASSRLILKKVLYTLTFVYNLIYIAQLTRDENCIVTYGANLCLIQDLTPKELIGAGELRNEDFYLKNDTGGIVFAAVHNKESVLWHQ